MSEIRIRNEVLAFAHMMEMQLEKNDSRGGWKSCTKEYLIERLEANLQDIKAGNRIGHSLADLANFAMMLADICDQLPVVHQPGPPLPGDVEALRKALEKIGAWLQECEHNSECEAFMHEDEELCDCGIGESKKLAALALPTGTGGERVGELVEALGLIGSQSASYCYACKWWGKCPEGGKNTGNIRCPKCGDIDSWHHGSDAWGRIAAKALAAHKAKMKEGE